MWKATAALAVDPVAGVVGQVPGPWLSRENTPVVGLHSGHEDAGAIARLYLPAAPAWWVENGLLAEGGRRSCEGLARTMLLGMGGAELGGPCQVYQLGRGMDDTSAANPKGVAFRMVLFARCYWHTSRAPDLYLGAFP